MDRSIRCNLGPALAYSNWMLMLGSPGQLLPPQHAHALTGAVGGISSTQGTAWQIQVLVLLYAAIADACQQHPHVCPPATTLQPSDIAATTWPGQSSLIRDTAAFGTYVNCCQTNAYHSCEAAGSV
jgi:hypothetical protein